MKLVYREQANRDLEGIFTWIARDSEARAITIVRRVLDAIELVLCSYPMSGRLTSRSGVRQWAVRRTPYLVLYRVDPSSDVLEVLSIIHGARDWSS